MKALTEWTAEEKRALIRKQGGDKAHLLNILLELQRQSGVMPLRTAARGKNYIDEETAELVAETVGIGQAQLYEVLRFYAMLETKPAGRFRLEVCNSSPCYYSKSDQIVELLREELGIGVGETTADGMFTIAYTPCVGACEIGPVIKVQDHIYGNLSRERVHSLIAQLRSEG